MLPRRAFKCNGVNVGAYDTSLHFAVPYNNRVVQKVVASLLDEGSVVLLYGARQAGKTSFATHVCDALKHAGRTVLRVSLEEIWQRFDTRNRALFEFTNRLHNVALKTSVAMAVPHGSVDPADWPERAFREPLIVMVDEFDSLLAAPGGQKVVRGFLHWIRAQLGKDSWLGGLLLVGTNGALLLKTTSGPEGPPDWNVANKLAMSRLSHDELRVVYKEFTEERRWPAIPDGVIVDILGITGGHKGWCMLAGACMDDTMENMSKHSRHPRGELLDSDMECMWQHAREALLSRLRGLESCARTKEKIGAMSVDDAQRVLGLLARTHNVAAHDVEQVERERWSYHVLHDDLGKLLTQWSVFDVVGGDMVVMGAPHMVSAAADAAVGVVEKGTTSVVACLYDRVSLLTMPMADLLSAMVLASFPEAMRLFHSGASVNRLGGGLLPTGTELPAEVCYKVALYILARAWLRGIASVCLEVRMLESKLNADLVITRRNKVHLIEVVSHERTVTNTRSSVVGHLRRLRDEYAPRAVDGAELLLLNYDRMVEDTFNLKKDTFLLPGKGTYSKVKLFSSGVWNGEDFSTISCMNVLLCDDLESVASVALWRAPRGADEAPEVLYEDHKATAAAAACAAPPVAAHAALAARGKRGHDRASALAAAVAAHVAAAAAATGVVGRPRAAGTGGTATAMASLSPRAGQISGRS
jgi:energy-coupling factor transporter ATP-binding protein EcfA2